MRQSLHKEKAKATLSKDQLENEHSIQCALKSLLEDPNFKFWDIHTHLFPPQATALIRFGIDELLNYHYSYRQFLGFRRDITPSKFFKLPMEKRSDLVWETYFAKPESSDVYPIPVSEGLRAISTILSGLGLDPNAANLDEARSFFAQIDVYDYHTHLLELAGVSRVIGTNNPFDKKELDFYRTKSEWHPGFSAALRLDDLVLNPPRAFQYIRDQFELPIADDLGESTISLGRQFCVDWLQGDYLPEVKYVGISFPPDFEWLDECDTRLQVLEKIVIPACEETGTSLFFMPEPVRGLEPEMRNAGDYLGKMNSVDFGRFCQRHPEVDLWVSPLNFSSQFEMSALSCVLPHVKPWSTWWYCHQPSLTHDISNLRIEMHGENSWLFNSDARVLEHLFSKWQHFKREFQIIATKQLTRVVESGFRLTGQDVAKWISTLFDPRKIRRSDWQNCLDGNYDWREFETKSSSSNHQH